MKKLIGLILLVAGFSATAHAGAIPRSAKETFVTPYQTTLSSVVIPSVNGSSGTALAPGAVYQVLLSTGASSEFVLLVDTNTCIGLGTAAVPTAPAKYVGPRLFYGSTTGNTNFAFDPPLIFTQGLCAIDSAVTGQAMITYELGRGISGQ